MITWIVVADASKAAVYETHRARFMMGKDHLKQVKALIHPASRAKDEGLVSDRLGNFKNDHGRGGSFVEASDPKESESMNFAGELAELLLKSHGEKCFDEFILVAPSRFYGYMNKHFNKSLDGSLFQVIEKDYTNLPIKELEELLQKTAD